MAMCQSSPPATPAPHGAPYLMQSQITMGQLIPGWTVSCPSTSSVSGTLKYFPSVPIANRKYSGRFSPRLFGPVSQMSQVSRRSMLGRHRSGSVSGSWLARLVAASWTWPTMF